MPSPGSIGTGLLHWGVPGIAGVAGFVGGDVFGVAAFVDEVSGGFLTGGVIPFQEHFAYEAFAGAGVYAIVVGIVAWLGTKFPVGGIVHDVIVKTVKWFLYGIIARLVLAGLVPSKISPAATLALPEAVR